MLMQSSIIYKLKNKVSKAKLFKTAFPTFKLTGFSEVTYKNLQPISCKGQVKQEAHNAIQH